MQHCFQYLFTWTNNAFTLLCSAALRVCPSWRQESHFGGRFRGGLAQTCPLEPAGRGRSKNTIFYQDTSGRFLKKVLGFALHATLFWAKFLQRNWARQQESAQPCSNSPKFELTKLILACGLWNNDKKSCIAMKPWVLQHPTKTLRTKSGMLIVSKHKSLAGPSTARKRKPQR